LQVKNAFRLEQSRALKLWDLAVDSGWMPNPAAAAEGSQRGSKGAAATLSGAGRVEEKEAE
jgi:hypothetical protein